MELPQPLELLSVKMVVGEDGPLAGVTTSQHLKEEALRRVTGVEAPGEEPKMQNRRELLPPEVAEPPILRGAEREEYRSHQKCWTTLGSNRVSLWKVRLKQ